VALNNIALTITPNNQKVDNDEILTTDEQKRHCRPQILYWCPKIGSCKLKISARKVLSYQNGNLIRSR